MRVCLKRKLAGKINGVDLKGYQAGDVLELPPSQARMLVTEGWATQETDDDRDSVTAMVRQERQSNPVPLGW
jgi:hypothetical protein